MEVLLFLLLACSGPAPLGETGAPGPGDTAPLDTGPPPTPFQLAVPLEDPSLFATPVVGFDHDPEVHDGIYRLVCTNYAGLGFPHCYDEHRGSDFLLDGGFEAMDAGSAWVVAAAPGEVVEVEDGHYDRCHGSLETLSVDCDGHEMVANRVVVRHDSGYTLHYLHFMAGSIAVSVGQRVERGERLALVGSSGMSSAPHLHLELQDPDGVSIDPYAGPESQPESWWCEQGDVDGLPGSCP